MEEENLHNNSKDSNLVKELYISMINGWNEQNADKMAKDFSIEGNLIGFDGSQVKGKYEIVSHLKDIFINHKTASFVTIIRYVRFITDDVCILEAVVGMIPPNQNDINPAVNAIQTIIARREDDKWFIEQLQNTAAAYHGRPELVEKLTNELREVIKK